MLTWFPIFMILIHSLSYLSYIYLIYYFLYPVFFIFFFYLVVFQELCLHTKHQLGMIKFNFEDRSRFEYFDYRILNNIHSLGRATIFFGQTACVVIFTLYSFLYFFKLSHIIDFVWICMNFYFEPVVRYRYNNISGQTFIFSMHKLFIYVLFYVLTIHKFNIIIIILL